MRESGVASSGEKTVLYNHCSRSSVREGSVPLPKLRTRASRKNIATSPRKRKGEENMLKKKTKETQRLQKSRCEQSCNRPACAASNFVHLSKRFISPRQSINFEMLKTAWSNSSRLRRWTHGNIANTDPFALCGFRCMRKKESFPLYAVPAVCGSAVCGSAV